MLSLTLPSLVETLSLSEPLASADIESEDKLLLTSEVDSEADSLSLSSEAGSESGSLSLSSEAGSESDSLSLSSEVDSEDDPLSLLGASLPSLIS